jgi:hypothetical protein
MLLNSVFSSFISSICEVSIFHPIDTLTKRHMVLNKLNYSNLYSGLKYAYIHKSLQRIIKYTGQDQYETKLQNILPFNKYISSGITGSIFGSLECILTPLNILKIKSQVDFHQTIQYYRGSLYTIYRNSIGSFILFSTSFYILDKYYHKNRYNASIYENFISSFIATNLCIFITNPIDIIKTQLQGTNKSVSNIIKTIIKKKMIFNGLFIKLISTAPQMIFSYTLTYYLIHQYHH